MTEDRFSQNDPIPLFLAGHTEEAGQPGARKVASSDVFRKATLVFAAAATLFAVVSVGRAILFTSVTASEASAAATGDSGSQSAPASTPAIQSTSNAEALPAPPSGGDLLAAFKAGVENRTEVDQPKVEQPKSEALFNQFKAWAAEEDAQALAPSPQPPEAVQAARAEIVPLPKRRPIHVEQTTRAHDPSSQNAPSLLRQLGWRH